MEKPIFEIIKEEDNKIFLKTNCGEMTLSKEEFIESMERFDSTHCRFNDKYFNEMQEKEEYLKRLYPRILIAQVGGKMEDILALGNIAEEYCTKFKCSIIAFLEDVKSYDLAFKESTIRGLNVHFNEKIHNIPDHLKNKNKKNKEEIKKESFNNNETMTIGQILKAQQN